MPNSHLKINFLHQANDRVISILIPVKNDVIGLRTTLDSLDLQHQPKGFHIEVLIGNDGDDPGVERIGDAYNITTIPITEKLGSYAIRNVLLTHSHGETIGFIDAGTRAEVGWVIQGLAASRENSYIGGPVEMEFERSRGMTSLFQYVSSFNTSEYIAKYHFSPTTNLWTKRSIFESLGGFDERLLSSGDYEWGERVYRAGTNQHFEPLVRVSHHERSLLELSHKQKRIAHGHAQLKLFYPERFGKCGVACAVTLALLFAPPIWIFRKKRFYALSFVEKLGVFGVAWRMHLIYQSSKLYYFVNYLLRRQ